MSNMLYLVLGWLAVALGALGVLLPILPTTPFILLAAFLFGKGSPKIRHWLLEHKIFGPMIQRWEEKGAISPKIKLFACSIMALSFLASWWFGVKPMVLIIQATIFSITAIYILSRPS